jgi:hypothetical protein
MKSAPDPPEFINYSNKVSSEHHDSARNQVVAYENELQIHRKPLEKPILMFGVNVTSLIRLLVLKNLIVETLPPAAACISLGVWLG